MNDNKQIIESLTTCPLFSALSEADLAPLASLVRVRKIPRRDTIFVQEQTCEGFFIVAQGRVKIFRFSPDGDEQVLSVAHPGHSFAEAAVFSGTDYPASAETLDESTVLFIPKDPFLKILRQQPELALKMLAGLSQRLRNLVALLEDVSLADVDTRLKNYLAKLVADSGHPGQGPATLTLPIPKHVLATHLAMTPPTLSRTLARLEEKGLIRIDGNRITIPDVSALSADVAP
jgi:CRP/FNR family transcriptional regulator